MINSLAKNKNILVTGGAGYIGSACTKALLDGEYNVTVLDNLSNGNVKYVDERATFIEADLLDVEALTDVFSNGKFNAVMHFAAHKAVAESEENPTKYFTNNIAGTINLLSAMESNGVGEMIFSSSAAVYAPTKEGVCTEESELGPINVYGNCKLIEERLIQELARTGKLSKFAILRYFNVAGDAGLNYVDQAPENVFPIIANSISSGGSFSIFGTDYDTRDGSCVRDYIHLSDLVDAHILALKHESSGIWNLGTSEGTSVIELIDAFEEVSSKKLSRHDASRRAGDPATLLADATSAAETLKWIPKKSLRAMVESTLSTYVKSQ